MNYIFNERCTACDQTKTLAPVGVDKLCLGCVASEAERCRDAIADARADGYAEAIEKAAQKADKECALRTCRCLPNRIAADIRALAPATTKEPK